MSSLKWFQVFPTVAGAVGSFGALLLFGVYTIGLIALAEGVHEPGFNYSSDQQFAWTSLGLAFLLGIGGTIVALFRMKTGGIILLVGGAVGLAAYMPFYQFFSDAFRANWFQALLLSPWWTFLMIAGGLFGLLGSLRAPVPHVPSDASHLSPNAI